MEKPAFVFCVVANLMVIVLALVLVQVGADWLGSHPVVERHIDELRGLAWGMILALPFAVVGRHVKLFAVRANAVRVSEENMPELHAIFVAQCKTLGVSPLPKLYLWRRMEAASVVYSLSGARSCVVLDADLLFGAKWRENLDCIEFAMGDALGSLRLGHTRWWVEMLTAYAIRIPALRGPIREARTYSRDRCAAFLVPDGVRGLLIRATGRELLRSIDVAAAIRQSLTPPGLWDRVSSAVRRHPHLHERVRLLYESGFFDLSRDLDRWGAAPQPRE
jgi:hypothetical protein